MAGADPRSRQGLLPVLVVSVVVVLVCLGQARGLQLSNLHNGLLALSFALVGAYVLHQRPGHREGRLFLLTGTVEAVLFLGRQIGHSPGSEASRWWGWLGVWPLALALALTTFAVICFPDGRLPSPRWRWTAVLVALVALGCSVLSAIWPVEYSSTEVVTQHPLTDSAPAAATAVWTALAHPAYAIFQLLWVLAVATRWRTATRPIRRQLTWLVGAAGTSLIALALGLGIAGTPVPGLLTATLVPIAAGWAIVHGQHVVAYSALSWLSRADTESTDLADGFARAVAEALDAAGATVWVGAEHLQAAGAWPTDAGPTEPVSLAALQGSADQHVRSIGGRRGAGAVSVRRPRSAELSLAEARLFDDLAAQAALVLAHLALSEAAPRRRPGAPLDALSPREREVLELMARGLTNAAICAELHLSIKTVEPLVSAVFTKLQLPADAARNRRVLAVLSYLRD